MEHKVRRKKLYVPDELDFVEMPDLRRSKRSSQTVLEITFNASGTVATSTLELVQDHDLIGQTKTGIWFAESNPNAFHNISYIPKPDMFNQIGEFDFYHNLTDGSAVTRFWDPTEHESYSGILKHKYSVKCVLLNVKDDIIDFVHQDDLSTTYARQTKKIYDKISLFMVIFKTHEDSNKSFRYRRHAKNLTLLDLNETEHENGKINYPPKIAYPKLLLVLDYNSVWHEKNMEDFFKQLVAHLNAVDMVYRTLQDPEVRLTITGIIIPRDKQAIPYIGTNYNIDRTVNADHVLFSLSSYFLGEDYRFPRNTYDVVVLMTTASLVYHDDDSQETIGIAGAAWGAEDSVIIQYRVGFNAVSTMVHELAHIFAVGHDGQGFSIDCGIRSGHIMTPGADLARILTWSECSKNEIKFYFRSELAKNMLHPPVEVPDSVKNMQGPWMSFSGQCQNQFKDATANEPVISPSDSCEKLVCIGNRTWVTMKHRPLDGVSCGIGKRCIKSECVDVV